MVCQIHRKEGISDSSLRELVQDVEAGKIDADLGGGVLKQRLSRGNQGKSGGYRTIILYKQGERALFVFGFSKATLGNISRNDELGFKKLAIRFLNLTDPEINGQIDAGQLTELKDD